MRPSWLLLAVALLACGACTDNSDGLATSVGAGKPILNTEAPVSPLPRYGRDIELAVRDGGLLDITTWGSGSCPYVPVEIERVTGKRVRVVMESRSRDDNDVCTDDLAATRATLRLPDDVNYRDPVRLDVSGVGPDRGMSVRLGFTNNGHDAVEVG